MSEADQIVERAEECKELYKDRGFFTMGDVARHEFELREVLEVLKMRGYKQLNEFDDCNLEDGYFYINDNWKAPPTTGSVFDV
ncbi:unnamed protein product [marine sediment metagenome]|uniref:Uncharacterized protein n=1 Tax=marine sediment metagenome TaxID=412755 RepID=X1AHS8_9ZZZZ